MEWKIKIEDKTYNTCGSVVVVVVGKVRKSAGADSQNIWIF